ncbi:hypothetical protein TI39_contig445g00002 [Zymoseptoria brevis]|uniref:Uncharacterized protein n=1 Tax=Zymoseptoria brevis TaxID=1047168 RepID=A0A0F4GP96_9PEZI|nr:hypothetical protein TI39_contig445g00002 [Zymoseptoria brevis]
MAPTTPKTRRSTRVQEAPARKKKKEEEEALKLAGLPPKTKGTKSIKSKTMSSSKPTVTKVVKSKPTPKPKTKFVGYPATRKEMFPYLYPPLEPDYEPKWQPRWGTWPTAPKAGPKACTFDKYYFFSFLGDAPRAQRALESLCKTLEESGFGGDVEKANKPLFDARDVLREWTEWRDSIPPDEYSY